MCALTGRPSPGGSYVTAFRAYWYLTVHAPGCGVRRVPARARRRRGTCGGARRVRSGANRTPRRRLFRRSSRPADGRARPHRLADRSSSFATDIASDYAWFLSGDRFLTDPPPTTNLRSSTAVLARDGAPPGNRLTIEGGARRRRRPIPRAAGHIWWLLTGLRRNRRTCASLERRARASSRA
jgi:hypothetical protein